jgi:hypothetical protein
MQNTNTVKICCRVVVFKLIIMNGDLTHVQRIAFLIYQNFLTDLESVWRLFVLVYLDYFNNNKLNFPTN